MKWHLSIGRPHKHVRDHLTPKKYSADLVLGTSYKCIVKKFRLFKPEKVNFTMLLQLVPETIYAENFCWTKMVPGPVCGSSGMISFKVRYHYFEKVLKTGLFRIYFLVKNLAMIECFILFFRKINFLKVFSPWFFHIFRIYGA